MDGVKCDSALSCAACCTGVPDRPYARETSALSQLQSEISFVDKWLTSHVSDHSALNHRKNVVSVLVAMLSGKVGKVVRDRLVDTPASGGGS